MRRMAMTEAEKAKGTALMNAIQGYDIYTAHTAAIAENIERDTLSNIEATQRMDTEADERELTWQHDGVTFHLVES